MHGVESGTKDLGDFGSHTACRLWRSPAQIVVARSGRYMIPMLRTIYDINASHPKAMVCSIRTIASTSDLLTLAFTSDTNNAALEWTLHGERCICAQNAAKLARYSSVWLMGQRFPAPWYRQCFAYNFRAARAVIAQGKVQEEMYDSTICLRQPLSTVKVACQC